MKKIPSGDNLSPYANSVRQITKHRFGVDSQSDPAKSYTVQRVPKSDIWYCDCIYFHYNITRKFDDERYCFHILACIRHRELGYKIRKIERIDVDYKCPKCTSTSFVKSGTRPIKGGLRRQLYKCNSCKARFSLIPTEFAKGRTDPKMIMDALYLMMGGMSPRNISRYLKRVHGKTVTHVSIIRWMKRYVTLIKEYTDKLEPNFSDVWSIDEMVLNVKDTKKFSKGFHVWLWGVIDPETRFLIASTISKKRTADDCKKIINKAKNTIPSLPNYVISDSLRTYEKVIRKKLKNTAHIKTKAIKDCFTNRPIERYHNEIRENLSARRGLRNDGSAQIFSDMLQLYHNYVKPHMGLDGKMPAQAAGIDLDLKDEKLEGLLRGNQNLYWIRVISGQDHICKLTISQKRSCETLICLNFL